MTDYRSLYDKDYIGAWDLQDKDVTVTISKVIGGQLTGQGGRKARKPIIYMHKTDKGFALNATNGKTIAALYGPLIENWAGKRITLYKSVTRNPDGTGDVDCIRVRPRVPGAKVVDEPPASAPAEPPPAASQTFSDSVSAEQDISLEDAVLQLEYQKDADKMAEWADTLPGTVTGDERFGAAYKKRLDAIRK